MRIESAKKGNGEETCEKVEEFLTSPADGFLVPMAEIPDEAFSSGVMGELILIENIDYIKSHGLSPMVVLLWGRDQRPL